MNKYFKFRVGINGLENKIYRDIVLSQDYILSGLADGILANFNSLSYQLNQIKIGKNYYVEYLLGELMNSIEGELWYL